jgi:hypothetical protein
MLTSYPSEPVRCCDILEALFTNSGSVVRRMLGPKYVILGM